ncbi:uncharacterized protein LAESUDRAFT_27749 [Laetiporus sulphureus 93-53]|uniref:Uncharacterized protein n=1 Tax=Laetiporus sulphureus 93-53 TaxID=1314785 RepID=A0A165GY48_9APHY|nr:uncharacterized protein LAESUDRAFT_359965 [Laetiporus sulphureus 93-53]XP_040770562.1 uncharacterized protein LAESUDRAFT_27749 [Laetiporus sulphureus 93-53]KZT10985.1 hypothetical protein LAESUDRAFT_359965 [Laetiporus sulphureus 93-53]KZT13052.1 hypothetical protein LAESUDRAFT_27749 [Laetiporus sulphureus 93-53]
MATCSTSKTASKSDTKSSSASIGLMNGSTTNASTSTIGCVIADALAARDKLSRLGIWRPRLLPAYDKHDHLVQPDKYEDALKGALVKAIVIISRWKIDSSLSFSMDIVELNIIDQPVSLLASPLKHRAQDSPAHSPTKKCLIRK